MGADRGECAYLFEYERGEFSGVGQRGCFSDALSVNTLSGASDGMPQRKRGFVLYIATSWHLRPHRRRPRPGAAAEPYHVSKNAPLENLSSTTQNAASPIEGTVVQLRPSRRVRIQRS